MLKMLALLPFLALPALAQQSQPGIVPPLTFPTPKIVIKSPPMRAVLQGCPVSLSAQAQEADQAGWVQLVGQSQRWKAPGTAGVHVRLTSLQARSMSHITVSVSFRAFAAGIVPASQNRPLQRKTFELDVADAGVLERDLLLDSRAQVVRVRVLKVTYTDGTEWDGASSATCSVRPSPIVLVAGR